ncbi:hypothetical protein JCM11491_004932 [Sporobolomyces phaffii]
MSTTIPDEDHCLVSDAIPDFYVWVEVDGQVAPVYSTVQHESKKTVCYIEAKEGKQFVVKYGDRRSVRPDYSYTFHLYVDGTRCHRHLQNCVKRHFRDGATASWRNCAFTGKKLDDHTKRPFLFSKLETTDDDDHACSDENVVKNPGTIQVKYMRVRNIQRTKESATRRYAEVETKPIHEQSKKAQLSHQAAFGEIQAARASRRYFSNRIDNEHNPLHTYEFRYRSRQLLQLENHLPHSPSPSPVPSPAASRNPRAAPSSSPFESPDAPSVNIVDTASSNPAAPASASPPVSAAEADRISRLQAELDSLRRQERIAALQREIATLQGSSSPGGNPSQSSSSRKIKAEPGDERADIKRVKQEVGCDAQRSSPSSKSEKGKGKAKVEVLVLSDSD